MRGLNWGFIGGLVFCAVFWGLLGLVVIGWWS